MTRLQQRCHGCGEDGAALVMVLAFLSLFGLAIASLLGFSQTSFKTTVVVRSQAGSLYAADGAVEGAINAIRKDTAAGVNPDLACKGFDPPALNKIDLTVTCQGTAVAGTGGAAPTNRPGQAILTTDSSGFAGIVQGSNNSVTIGGNVYVNSKSSSSAIQMNSSSSMRVTGNTRALGPCAGVSATTDSGGTPSGTVSCSSTNTPFDTPGYSVGTDVPTTRPAVAASCPTTTDVVALSPGFYDSAASLNTISACADTILWFQPGVYYFDFADSGGADAHKWRVNSPTTYLTGGVPLWSTSSPTLPLTIPGSCDARDIANRQGVKFIFGNDSRLSVDGGKLELCAPWTAPTGPDQQIAIYGLRSGTSSPLDTMVGPYDAVSSTFSNADNAKAIEGSTGPATAGYTTTSTDTTASILLSFNSSAAPPVVPVGSVVNSVTMRAAYRLTNKANVDSISASVIPGDGSTALDIPTANNCPATTLCQKDDQYYDVRLDITNTLRGASPSATLAKLTGAKVRFNAAGKTKGRSAPGIVELDGITLTINYTVPGFRAWTGCTTSAGVSDPYPYLATQYCALLRVTGDPARVAIHGTFYGPGAPLDLELTNRSSQVVDRGVISSVLWLKPTASFASGSTPISLPPVPPSTPAGRTVTIRAYEGGKLLLVAEVAINDMISDHPVSISHWSYQR